MLSSLQLRLESNLCTFLQTTSSHFSSTKAKMNRFVLIAVMIALAVHARQEKEAPPLTSRESMAEEVTIETLAGGGSVFSSHAQKLLRVSISSTIMLDFGKRRRWDRCARSVLQRKPCPNCHPQCLLVSVHPQQQQQAKVLVPG